MIFSIIAHFAQISNHMEDYSLYCIFMHIMLYYPRVIV